MRCHKILSFKFWKTLQLVKNLSAYTHCQQVELVVDRDVERHAASPGPEKRAGRFAGRGRREPRRGGGAPNAAADVVGEQADADRPHLREGQQKNSGRTLIDSESFLLRCNALPFCTLLI